MSAAVDGRCWLSCFPYQCLKASGRRILKSSCLYGKGCRPLHNTCSTPHHHGQISEIFSSGLLSLLRVLRCHLPLPLQVQTQRGFYLARHHPPPSGKRGAALPAPFWWYCTSYYPPAAALSGIILHPMSLPWISYSPQMPVSSADSSQTHSSFSYCFLPRFWWKYTSQPTHSL